MGTDDIFINPAAGGDWADDRLGMLRALGEHGVRGESVLAAMAKVRRHAFIPACFRSRDTAYGDHPEAIGHGQTISQPFIVAYMTEKILPLPGEKVLEIGTGSGYQAAVLAELGAEVYSVEIVPGLARHARAALRAEGYGGVNTREGDGRLGWPEAAPFDAIIATCAPLEVPGALVGQLRQDGRMILPVGPAGMQRLVIVRKRGGAIERTDDLPVRFVPMVGEQPPVTGGSEERKQNEYEARGNGSLDAR